MNQRDTDPSLVVQRAGESVVRVLRDGPREGASLPELARLVDVSVPTLRRALRWLREEQGAPVEFSRATGRWSLLDREFTMPLADPSSDDLVAALFAGALLAPHADSRLRKHLDRLVEDLDARVRATPRGLKLRAGSLTASVSASQPVDLSLLDLLLRAVKSAVVRIIYKSPWTNVERDHDFEPWQLRLHDGVAYVRGWSRLADAPRSFRLAHIRSARRLEGEIPRAPVPHARQIWGAGELSSGIDEDRPSVARLLIRGPTARAVAAERWSEAQVDTWLVPEERLERRLPYPSVRELARRILALGEAVEDVEPQELRDEVVRHAAALVGQLRPSQLRSSEPRSS